MSWTKEQIEEAVAKVVEKASTDAEFRKLVLSNIHTAVEEVTGTEVPESFEINVVDGTGYHATIILPEVRGAESELTEKELETVAGGMKEYPIPLDSIPLDPIKTVCIPLEPGRIIKD